MKRGVITVPDNFEEMCERVESAYDTFLPMVRHLHERYVRNPDERVFFPRAVFSRDHLAGMANVRRLGIRLENFGIAGEGCVPTMVLQNIIGPGEYSVHGYAVSDGLALPFVPKPLTDRRRDRRYGQFVLGKLYKEIDRIGIEDFVRRVSTA